MALSQVDSQMAVTILELPYIFGAQPGRRPVWVFLVEQLLGMKGPLAFYPRGGTAMVTVRQVGQCIGGAVEKGKSGQFPVGWFNMTWREMLRIMYRHMGQPGKRIITIPDFLFRLQTGQIMRQKKAAGIQPGLDLVRYVQVMTARTFIDRSIIEQEFGVRDDNLEAAIGDSVGLSMDILAGRIQAIGMQANP
jgi:dihydroflavonol-4-reductase